ncbi:hypothetical protein [Aeromicrobium wangtongii]|uniref:hypothetical protein n=1 Tax=Aeromicrobium wangtongii TaxID=2969247 RepID=UPI0020177C6A|nr:hypothetical protein [Aeromicrobium wangtongii]MCL3818241.1 hypothetical protein [Aeromicrobium wangtongii]
MFEEVLVAVRGGAADVGDLVARLGGLGLVGWAIDGARLGHEGWVVARLAADEEGLLAVDRDGDLQLLELDDLRAALAPVWPDVQVGDVVIGGHELLAPLCQSPSERLHEVAVATARGMRLDLEASMEKLTLAEVRTGDRVLFGRVQPVTGPEHRLIDVFTSAKGGSIVLWRREPYLVLQVLDGREEAELHVWGPEWSAVGSAAQDGLRDLMRPVEGDAAEIVALLDLPAESVEPLRAVLGQARPPLGELCHLLGLPDEAAWVLSGECAVEDLSGAIVHEPKTFVAALRDVARPSDDDPAWVQWMDRGARELRPWYVVSSVASIAAGGAMIAAWRSGRSRLWGVLGVTTVLGSAVDLPVRWVLRRRRSRG